MFARPADSYAEDPRRTAEMLAAITANLPKRRSGIFGTLARTRYAEDEPRAVDPEDMSPTLPDGPRRAQDAGPPSWQAQLLREPPLEQSPKTTWAEKLQDLGTGLAAASAFWNGDFADGAAISAKGRETAANRLKLKMQEAQRARVIEAMRNQGYSDDQIALALTNSEAFGNNYNQRFGTRVVAPGSSVVSGGPGGQQAVFTQPNQYEQYAAALGNARGTPGFNTAVTDYVLRSNGPTALSNDKAIDDYRTGNRVRMEGVRQGHREKLEGIRHGNRITARQTPSYRDLNPPPPRPRPRPTREAIVTVRTPEEARKLAPGTRFRTPDGRVKIR
jgi:hypothetical protein